MLDRVSTVLGDSRPVTHTYGDGSVDCPFCSYPIVAPKTSCENPCCDAYPGWRPEDLREHRAKCDAEAAREAREEANRKAVLDASRERAEEQRAWEHEQIAEARARGACLRCLFQAGWRRVRFVRHRLPCPKAP